MPGLFTFPFVYSIIYFLLSKIVLLQVLNMICWDTRDVLEHVRVYTHNTGDICSERQYALVEMR